MMRPARDPKRKLERLRSVIAAQAERGDDPALAYLHVPKTAGSGLQDLLPKMRRAGIRPPTYLSHDFDLETFAELMPASRLVVVLRDPLERMASGFMSRLRQGRPRNDRLWTPAEAVAFQAYRRPEEMFRACLSGDDYDISMSSFALDAIPHVRRGYAHYFGSAGGVRAAAGRFALVGEIGDMGGFIGRLADLLGAPRRKLASLYEARHVSPRGGAEIVAGLAPPEIAALRRRFEEEYRIWEALRALPAARG